MRAVRELCSHRATTSVEEHHVGIDAEFPLVAKKLPRHAVCATILGVIALAKMNNSHASGVFSKETGLVNFFTSPGT
jgi:flagellar motor component MotA